MDRSSAREIDDSMIAIGAIDRDCLRVGGAGSDQVLEPSAFIIVFKTSW
jgi:hypothetical protein